MKNKPVLLVTLFVISVFSACKKDNTKPASATNTQSQSLTVAQMLAGKWFVVKDSVQTLDTRTPIPNVGPILSFNNSDFVMFNKDSTATISSLVAFNAFFTNYKASNADSKLSVALNNNPYLNFKYSVVTDYTIPANSPSAAAQKVYALKMQNVDPFVGAGFDIAMPSTDNVVLHHQETIPTVLHSYVIDEYIYLSR